MTFWEFTAATGRLSEWFDNDDDEDEDAPDFETMKRGLMAIQESERVH